VKYLPYQTRLHEGVILQQSKTLVGLSFHTLGHYSVYSIVTSITSAHLLYTFSHYSTHSLTTLHIHSLLHAFNHYSTHSLTTLHIHSLLYTFTHLSTHSLSTLHILQPDNNKDKKMSAINKVKSIIMAYKRVGRFSLTLYPQIKNTEWSYKLSQ